MDLFFVRAGVLAKCFFWTSVGHGLLHAVPVGVPNSAIDYVNGYLGLYLGAKPKLN